MEDGLWIFLLEAAVALCLLLGIVWATWPKGKPETCRPQAADPLVNGEPAKPAQENTDEPR